MVPPRELYSLELYTYKPSAQFSDGDNVADPAPLDRVEDPDQSFEIGWMTHLDRNYLSKSEPSTFKLTVKISSTLF